MKLDELQNSDQGPEEFYVHRDMFSLTVGRDKERKRSVHTQTYSVKSL